MLLQKSSRKTLNPLSKPSDKALSASHNRLAGSRSRFITYKKDSSDDESSLWSGRRGCLGALALNGYFGLFHNPVIHRQTCALCSCTVRTRDMRVLANISTNKKSLEKSRLFLLAGDEARTRDILLGKEAFYH